MSVMYSSDTSCSGEVDILLVNADGHRRTVSALSPQQSAAQFAASTILQFHLATAVVIMVMAIAFCIS